MRTIQYAVVTIAIMATVLYSILMGGLSFVLNNFLRFNPNGHAWDVQNDPVFLIIISGTLGLIFSLEAARSLIQRNAESRDL